jgi:GT2 family glycosyltransferase
MRANPIEITKNQSLTEYCQSLFKEKHYQKLEELLNKAIVAEPHKSDIWVWLAMLYLEKKQLAEAYRAIEQALQFNRTSASIYAILGKILFAQNSAMAEQAWRRAVYLDPENILYRKQLAKALENNKKAKGFIEKSVKIKTVKNNQNSEQEQQNESIIKDTIKNPCVIIPVYDDFETLEVCLTSVINTKHLCKIYYDILVINDKSPSEEITHYLQQLNHSNKIYLIENDINLGFIRTVNKALDYTKHNDIVLLNSDTQVFHNWFDRLYNSAYSKNSIASVTPLSNNAQLFSFPKSITDNTLTDQSQAALIDQACKKANKNQTIEVPTGIGFCLFLKKDVLNQIGYLDDKELIRGYGEDIDLCLRIKEAGWLNICATDVFVAHHGNKSFKSEKRLRVFQNQKILNQRYPNNEQIYSLFIRHDPLYAYRHTIELELLNYNKKTYQLIISPKDGFLHGKMQKVRFEQATSEKNSIWLYYDSRYSKEKSHKYLSLSEDKPMGYHNLKYRWFKDCDLLKQHLSLLNISDIIIYDKEIIDSHLENIIQHYSRKHIDINKVNVPTLAANELINKNERLKTLQPINIAIVGELDNPKQHYWLLQLARFIRYNNLAFNFWLLDASLNPNELLNTGIVTFASQYTAGLGEWHQRLKAANIHALMSINDYNPFLIEAAITVPNLAILLDQTHMPDHCESLFYKYDPSLLPNETVAHILKVLNKTELLQPKNNTTHTGS